MEYFMYQESSLHPYQGWFFLNSTTDIDFMDGSWSNTGNNYLSKQLPNTEEEVMANMTNPYLVYEMADIEVNDVTVNNNKIFIGSVGK